MMMKPQFSYHRLALLSLLCILFFYLAQPTIAQQQAYRFQWLPTEPIGQCAYPLPYGYCGKPQAQHNYICYDTEMDTTTEERFCLQHTAKPTLPIECTDDTTQDIQYIDCKPNGTCDSFSAFCNCDSAFIGKYCLQARYAWATTPVLSECGMHNSTCGSPYKLESYPCYEYQWTFLADDITQIPTPVANSLCPQNALPPAANKQDCPGSQPIGCGTNGQCTLSGTTSTCKCNPGWWGNECDQEIIYLWVADEFDDSTCIYHNDRFCGPKQKYRDVICKTQHSQEIVADSFCDITTKPTKSMLCDAEPTTDKGCNGTKGTCNTETGLCECIIGWEGNNCETVMEFKWSPLPWGECKVPLIDQFCGPKVKERTIECVVAKDSTNQVDNSYCFSLQKPITNTTDGCEQITPGCGPNGSCVNETGLCECNVGWEGDNCEIEMEIKWYPSAWGECKIPNGNLCGPKVKERTLECVVVAKDYTNQIDISYCANIEKPITNTTDGCEQITPGCGPNADCDVDNQKCTCHQGWAGGGCDIKLEPVEFRFTSWSECKKSEQHHVCGRPSRYRDLECYLKSTNEKLTFNDVRCQTAYAEAEDRGEEFIYEDWTSCSMLPQCKNGGYCNTEAGTATCNCPHTYYVSDGDCSNIKDDIRPPTRQYYWKYKQWGECQLLSTLEGKTPQGCEMYYRIREAICVNRDDNDKEMDSSWCLQDQGTANNVIESCFMVYPPCDGQTGKWIGTDLTGKDPYEASNTAFNIMNNNNNNNMIMMMIMLIALLVIIN